MASVVPGAHCEDLGDTWNAFVGATIDVIALSAPVGVAVKDLGSRTSVAHCYRFVPIDNPYATF